MRIAATVVACFILAALVAVFIWQSQRAPEQNLSLLRNKIDVGSVRKEVKHDVSLVVVNSGSQPLRVVGFLNEPC